MARWPGMLLGIWLCAAAPAQDDALAARSRAGTEALRAGRYAEAVAIYRELTAALPDNPGLRFNLGLALERAGKPAEAIPQLERATRGEPGFAPAWFLLGLAYQQLGHPEKALGPLRHAVGLDAANTQARLELGDAELAAGDPAAAAESFRALAARRPDVAKAWQGLGLADVALAERAYGLLLEHAPQSAYRKALAAGARAGEGRSAAALALYAEALRDLPSLPGLHAARAALYREVHRPEWAAVEEQREAQAPQPDCASHPAACAWLAGRFETAIDQARRAATPENFYWTALAYGKLAERSFAKLAALPPSPEIHELQAESFQRMGRRADAVAEWRKALAMHPGDRRLTARLAESLSRNRDYEAAARLLEPLVQAQPENGEWQYLLGDALLQQHREADALPHLESAVRLRPDFPPAQEALGRACLALGRNEEAVQHLERARAIDDGAISFALSTAYRRLGHVEEATAALARYRRMTEESGTAPGENAEIPPP